MRGSLIYTIAAVFTCGLAIGLLAVAWGPA